MKISVVVGGQYGSEGKGKAALFLAKKRNAQVAIRVGGANSGHTVYWDGKPQILYHLPAAAFLKDIVCVIGPGSYINISNLKKDLEKTGLNRNRFIIDRNVFIIGEDDILVEKYSCHLEQIASTFSGTGNAVIRRMLRDSPQYDIYNSDLRHLGSIRNTVDFLYHTFNKSRVILEGTQGFGLSVLHADSYPYVTSRDTIAAGFLSEAGLSPIDVDEILMVIRAFPIRVGGTSGILPNETCWEKISEISGYSQLKEYTSVTKKLRRVGMFDSAIVNQAIKANKPTAILLNHVDYFDNLCNKESLITEKALKNVQNINSSLIKKIDFIGVGPKIDDIISFEGVKS